VSHLASSGLGVPSVNAAMTALRCFFKVTLRRGDVTEDIVFAREPRRKPVVLSPEEVAREYQKGDLSALCRLPACDSLRVHHYATRLCLENRIKCDVYDLRRRRCEFTPGTP
jgi:hypothetical protein